MFAFLKFFKILVESMW